MEKLDVVQPIKTVLDGLNYPIWSQEMSSFLKGRRLWRIVTGTINKPTKEKDEDDSKFWERLEDWDSKNHQILTWIRNTTIPSIKLHFARFETAKEVWDLLSKRYSTTNVVHQYQLHETLYNMKQLPDQSINDFLSQMQGIWDQLAMSEPSWENAKDAEKFVAYRDNLRVLHFLMVLTPSYEPVRANILHRGSLPSLENVVSELLSEETRLSILKPKSSELVDTNNVLAVASLPAKPECNYCKRPGHVISECRKLQYKNKKSQTTQGKNRQYTRYGHTVGAAVDEPPAPTPTFSLNDLQNILQQLANPAASNSQVAAHPVTSSALSVIPGSSNRTDYWDRP